MTLRLPLELREAVTEEARVKGDLAKIVPVALSHVDRKDVEIRQSRKRVCRFVLRNYFTLERRLGPPSGNGLKGRRERQRDCGKCLGRVFQTTQERSKALREELRLEIRARRGIFAGLVGNANNRSRGLTARIGITSTRFDHRKL